MNHEDVERIIVEQGNAAAERQGQLRKMLIGAFVYITVVATIYGIIIFNSTQTSSDLADVLNRRSPVLEYIRCHDSVEDARDGAQTRFLLALLDAGSTPTAQQQAQIDELRKLYENAEIRLSAASDVSKNVCPDLPTPEEGD